MTTDNETPLLGVEQLDAAPPFGHPPIEIAAHRPVHALFNDQAAATPDGVAVIFEDTRTTYAELNRRANRLAHHLLRRGIGPDQLVGICIERCPEMVVGLLAILKAGGAYVPIDPSYPEERIDDMLGDSGACVVLTAEKHRGHLKSSATEAVCLDRDQHLWEHEPDTDPGSSVSGEHLAYVIYTSGSTGRPKGAMNEHRAVVNRLLWMQQRYGLTPEERVLQKTPFSFDVSVWEFFWPLISGATLVLAKPKGHKDPGYLAQILKQQNITTLHFVPSMLAVFLEEAECAGEFPNLKRVISSGEALTADLVERFFRVFPDVHLENLYGPTECAIDVTAWSCRPGDQRREIPIGKPVANTRAYILDPAGRPTPVGVPGELHIGGVQVGRGYWNRPELTRERFIPDPFCAEPGAKLYRTGDLCRWNADGEIEFLGRMDDQIKLRGFRIELGEIESRIREHPKVANAAVLLREDHPGDKKLVAYFTGSRGENPRPNELKQHCLQTLPDHMVPSAFVSLREFSLTSHGKLDRSALPAPHKQVARTRYVEPQTPTQWGLIESITQLLGVKGIGLDDRFFALGGNSLLATQLRSRIRHRFGVQIPMRVLFDARTIGEIAELIDRQSGGEHRALGITPAPRNEDTFALTDAQARLWFLDQMSRGTRESLAYLMCFPMRIEGPLDVACLERSFQTVVDRHESLRTCFVEIDGEARQVIRSDWRVPFHLYDLTDAPAEQRFKLRDQKLRDIGSTGFDVSAAPPFRVDLVRLTPEEHVLAISMHHVISDGWSMNVLGREVGQVYEAYRNGASNPLKELELQYADYAIWQRSAAHQSLIHQQMTYWKDQLADLPAALNLPIDRPRPQVQTSAGGTYSRIVPASLVQALHQLGQSAGTTLFMTVAAAYSIFLGRHANQNDVAIGTPVSGRSHRELEYLIGFFVNTVVLRGQWDDTTTFKEFLAAYREVCFGAYEHQEVPFERLVSELNPDRRVASSPLFQAMLVFDDFSEEALALPGLCVKPERPPATAARFDLVLNLKEREGHVLRADWEYNTDLFDESTIARLAQRFEVFCEALARRPATKVMELPVLAPGEKEELTRGFNETGPCEPPTARVHHLFEAQAAKTPEATALRFENASWSYGELERRANRLAHTLRQRGVGPGSLVGLYLDRCPEMIASVLAVLKAGGAYLPIDPDYPEKRVDFMVEDSGVSLLLTKDSLSPRLGGDSQPRLLYVDREDHLEKEASRTPPACPVGPKDLAYVIYTSGSTGQPKGAMLEHQGLEKLVEAQGRWFGIKPQTRVLQFASLGFDAAVSEIFVTLCHGGELHLPPAGVRLSGEDLGQRLLDQRIQSLTLTPSVLATVPPGAYPDLETLIVAGEPCPPQLVETWAKGRCFLNAYGPTEATVCATIGACEPNGSSPTIGRPLPHVQAYVLDDHGEPVPRGVIGELCIGGLGVARGYLNRPELTAAKFTDDPFSSEPDARLYRTGDLCRWLPDGELVYVGRRDDQVKLRGFRIECGEVETRLLDHPRVSEAVVMVREDRPRDRKLVAYIVTAQEGDVETAALRDHLSRFLADYMIPAAFVTLDALPLSPSGKVDRAQLPPPVFQSQAGTDVAPKTPAEAVVTEVVAQVLGLERVSVKDNFFELGGDSILLLQVVSRVRARGFEITPRQMYEQPTLGALAAVAQASSGQTQTDTVVTGAVPLTPIQTSFLNRGHPHPHHFNQAVLLQPDRDLDDEALEEAFDHLVRHHDALRMRFATRGGQWEQWSPGPGECESFAFHTVALPSRDPQSAIETACAEAQSSLSFEEGPLVKAIYFQGTQSSKSRLFIAIHHLVVDGVSWRILLEDLETAYRARERKRAPLLPCKTTSFRTWSQKLTRFASSPALASQKSHWQAVNAVDGSLPRDINASESANTMGSVEEVEITLSPEQTRALLQDVPKAYRTRINDVLLAALAQTLGEWTGRQRIRIDLEGHGREELFEKVDLSRTIGWFTSLFPVALQADADAQTVLKQTKENLRAIPEKGLGYGILRDLTKDETLVSPAPADLCFNYLGQFQQDATPQGARLFTPVPEPHGATCDPSHRREHAIEVNGAIQGDTLVMSWGFSRSLHRRKTIEWLAGCYKDNLENLIATCSKTGDVLRAVPSPAADDLDQIRSKIDSVVEQHMYANLSTAAVIGVYYKGEKAVWGYGPESDQLWPTAEEAIFPIGSITKTFTGILLAEAVESRILDLDENLASPRLFPELEGTPAGMITLRQLTTHLAGLPNLPDDLEAPPYDEHQPFKHYSVDRALRYLRRTIAHGASRNEFRRTLYSSLGTGLLGHGLARAHGKTYEELIQENIARPLGLTDTTVTVTSRQQRRMAPIRNEILDEVSHWESAEIFHGSGALYSTTTDLLTFLEANLSPPKGLLGDAIRRSHGRLATGVPENVGMNWFLSRDQDQGAIWHNGLANGATSLVAFDKEKNLGLTVLSNSSWPIAGIYETVFADQSAPDLGICLSDGQLESRIGRYEFPDYGVLTVKKRRNFLYCDGLFIPGLPQTVRLVARSSKEFSLQTDAASVTFGRDESEEALPMTISFQGKKIHGNRIDDSSER